MAENLKNECPNCGYSMTKNEPNCKYCGSINPLYKKPFYPTSPSNNTSNTQQPNSSDDDKNINWVIFVVLLIFCWPVAVVYLLVKLSK
jgi:uncharacterized membrane protein YvbJ